MSFNGSGVFVINTAGQPVVAGTTIEVSPFNLLTADLATGLSTAITKDGQTTVTANIPMAGFKITGLGLGTAATDATSVANCNTFANEFRLSLTTAVPVTTSDVTGATTVYCVPYKGNHIALYNGTSWVMRQSAEFSLAVGTLTSGRPYDVFCYDNVGVPTLEFLAWTNDTTRATALVMQDGVLSKTGALTRRYMGTFYTTSTTQTEDSFAKRFLWNYYNRIRRVMNVVEATDTWNYTLTTIRQANGSTANQLDMVIGVNEDMVSANIQAIASNGTGGNIGFGVGVGLDVTNGITNIGGLYYGGMLVGATTAHVAVASYKGYVGAGRHFLSWNEWSAATGTTTWQGDGGTVAISQSGIHGEIWG